jgi:prolyl oligopeptidase
MKRLLLLSIVLFSGIQYAISQDVDPYLWLENVDGKEALDWVNQQNTKTLDVLTKQAEYQPTFNKALEIYNSSDRIANPGITLDFVYNFWQDKEHVRGIWRRTPKYLYLDGKPEWEILLDMDQMSTIDGVKWVFKGASGLYPAYSRFLVNLSKGGGDATVTREFDVDTKSFVPNGFFIPESKGSAGWIDINTLIVSSNFGEGTMTTSGYPRQVKLWKRGTPLTEAKLIFEGTVSDMSCSGYNMRDGNTNYTIVEHELSFYKHITYIWQHNQLTKLDLPDDAGINELLNNQLIVSLKSDWNANGTIYKEGAVISLNFTSLILGQKEIQLIVQPDDFSSVSSISATKNKLLINMLTNVKNELYIYSLDNGRWSKIKVAAPDFGTISMGSTDEFSDQYFFYYQNFLTPSSLYFADAKDNSLKVVKSLPAFYDASKYKVTQYKAPAPDGTMIPYFVVSSKSIEFNGKNPTLLYAYGGFEVSSLPTYSGTIGNAWLEKGGVYVLANIRGGGEFGPKWHKAGLKEKRQVVFEDLYAVTMDLFKNKITSANNLGVMGGSNGGLLVGVAFTQHPELYKAVICAVPLLDMQRYNKLLAGASWMDEYGNPDIPAEWEYIKKYSPYQNLKKGAKYPEVFFTTSTRDDRVHPGHARKMVARMNEMGYKVYYFENTEGGHAGSSTNEQRAKTTALQYSYLWMKLKN